MKVEILRSPALHQTQCGASVAQDDTITATFGGRVFPHSHCLDMGSVDNPRLFVDKCLSLWRSPKKAENIHKPIPPDMGGDQDSLQDVEKMRKPAFLWISLWMSLADSLHRERWFR